jgi:hypothetical protein
MCAEASTVLRAIAEDFFFNCWCLEIPSDNRIRYTPRCVHCHAGNVTQYSIKQVTSCCCVPLLGLFSDLENGGNVLLWNVRLSADCMVLQHRRLTTVRTSHPAANAGSVVLSLFFTPHFRIIQTFAASQFMWYETNIAREVYVAILKESG